jgi:hypothetical protein
MKKLLFLIPLIVLLPLTANAAIVGTQLTAGFTNAGNSTGTTASITPAANSLILLAVTERTNLSANTNQPTVAGNGLTWVLVNDILYDTTSASRKRVSVFRAMGASPTKGGITIDFAGQVQTDIDWDVAQFTGTDTSGTNGSGAIVQSTTTKDEAATTGTLPIAFSSLSSANNIFYVGAAGDGAGQQSSGYDATFTGLGTASSTNMGGVMGEYKLNALSAKPTWTGGGSMMGDVAVEIKAATATPTRRRQTMIVSE